VRVVAGALGGRRLVAPAGDGTRPTTDRVREALFSILGGMGVVEEARVLDLYAGTGALAIEAISRGAAFATLVESNRAALAALRENVRQLDIAQQVQVIGGRAEVWIRGARDLEGGPFDLVLCDPPWSRMTEAAAVLARLARRRDLAPEALVVVEHAAREPMPAIDGLEREDERRWGDTAIWLGRRAHSSQM
jgi:16S rRNA (guanine966-N2)-methyltransferase